MFTVAKQMNSCLSVLKVIQNKLLTENENYCSGETEEMCEQVKKKQLIVRREHEKNKSANESEESRQKRLTQMRKNSKKNEYSDNELENMNWEEKCRLIQSDPVTCARHFDYQFSQFLKHCLMSSAAPLGKIADWFYRFEYQQRGSPHIHMLIWLEDAPVFGCDDDHDVTSFIDKIITCEKRKNDPALELLVNRQIHQHCQTCCKKSKAECRFNFPQPPMKSTTILYPLGDDVSESEF